ncbi:DUF3853 family protein [Sphingobacterium bovistauri]|uniref:DUF3853 family protein n=1 Tax=Sphingobacterium bovistauri TaxID=2781959 RepID=A0ABS7Z3Q3_9SPHI|nr:DUF3853 family protein [Sphingobacterium bovistauri]MCA5004789.1 DUF3853 family protein [Sphingobacterium bovistauri]
MDIHSLLKKPVAMMTGEELIALQAEAIKQIPKEEIIKTIPEFEYGLSGIMRIFSCSKSKAQRLKDGIIKGAIDQDQRTIIIDVKKALELFQAHSRNKKGRLV